MKRFLPLLLLLGTCVSMLGRPIDETTAKNLADNFWKQNHIMAVKNGMVFKNQTVDAHFVNLAPQYGYSEFFLFNNTSGEGFVIMATDDCVQPILGYSYENHLGSGPLPPNFLALLDEYAAQIQSAIAMRAVATSEVSAEWACLREDKTLPVRSETSVAPLIATQWDQDPYYNALCPYDSHAHERTLTGCVATAMAQVMKYWSYPEHGSGSHSYVPSAHPEYGSLYVDFSSVNYQWSSMPNSVNSSNNAVATLMYHCGVSVDMDYGISGSPDYGSAAYIIDGGSNRACAETALKTYFDYKSSLHSVVKSSYSDAQWISLLKTELDQSRPMLYGGFGNSGGHAFVCDGYNNSNYFHFNWGWSGYCDGYFSINNLNPSSSNYSSNQQAIIGIEPSYSGNGGGGGGGGSSNSFDLVYHCNLDMNEEYWFYDDLSVYAEILNTGSSNYNGLIGAGVFRKEGNEYRFVDVMDRWDMVLSPGYYLYGTLQCAGGPPYTPGSYAVAILYSMDGNLWNLIDCLQYEDAYFDIVYSADIETNSNFSITSGDYLHFGETATINVDAWNSTSSTFYGKFRVNLANPDGSWAQNIAILNCSNGLPANYHYTNGLDFTGPITVEPGTYYIELAFQPSGSSNWYYTGASEFPNPVVVEVVAPSVSLDRYESNNSVSSAYSLPFNLTGGTASIATSGANLHNDSDIDYYKVQLNPGSDYSLRARLNDSYSSEDGNYYTVDAKVAYSTDGSHWSDFYDDAVTSFSTSNGTVYFCVMPYFEGRTGTYQLSINITAGTGVDENTESRLALYPNPVREMLNVTCNGAKEIRVYDLLGTMVKRIDTGGRNDVAIDMSDLPNGIYTVQAFMEGGVASQSLVKAE